MLRQENRKPVVRQRRPRLQRDGLAQAGFGLLPFETVLLRRGQRDVRFRERRIESHGAGGGCRGPRGRAFTRRHHGGRRPSERIRVGQSRVGQREVGIARDRLLMETARSAETVRWARNSWTALEIEVEGLEIAGARARSGASVSTAESSPQRQGNARPHLGLHRKHYPSTRARTSPTTTARPSRASTS